MEIILENPSLNRERDGLDEWTETFMYSSTISFNYRLRCHHVYLFVTR